MIAYTNYSGDARIQREAETIASIPDFKVLVLSLKEKASPRVYIKNGVEVRELNLSKYCGKNGIGYLKAYFKFLLLAFMACNRLLFNRSLDIVHVHNMPNFLVISAIIPFLFHKKIILDIHDTVIETFSAKFDGVANWIIIKMLRLEEFICCAFAHKIISVNHIQKEALVKRGISARKLIISMNIPDPKRFVDNGRMIKHNPKKNFRMVYFGTITKRLGIDLAIRAIAKLDGKCQGLEFHVIGDGDDIQNFINLSKDLGIGKNIHFYRKFIPHEELIKVVEDMDLGIIPNRRNAATDLMLPVKMLECIALGIPVIAPRLKTIEYYFSDDMVFYFEPDNVDALADTIQDAFNTESKRITKAENAKRFLKEYGWETHKYELINLYKSLS